MFDRIDGVPAIQYFGRSGSYLLSSLFDSHPQILSLPPHSFMRAHRFITEAYRNYKDRNQIIEHLYEELVSRFPLLFKYNKENAAAHSETLFECASMMHFGII